MLIQKIQEYIRSIKICKQVVIYLAFSLKESEMHLSYQNVFELVVNGGGLCVESWGKETYMTFLLNFKAFVSLLVV